MTCLLDRSAGSKTDPIEMTVIKGTLSQTRGNQRG
eukprot:SAG25_NODE_1154_length_3771_cov_3.469227_1_plen_34_part_10